MPAHRFNQHTLSGETVIQHEDPASWKYEVQAEIGARILVRLQTAGFSYVYERVANWFKHENRKQPH